MDGVRRYHRETQEDKAVWQKLKQGFLDQGMGDEEGKADTQISTHPDHTSR